MEGKKIFIGCGVAVLVLGLALVIACYSASRAFIRYGIGTDLSDYRDAIVKMDIDPEAKKNIVFELEALRISLDRTNNFGFFQWLEIDDSVQGVIADGTLDDGEYDVLMTDIARMKRIQGIEASREKHGLSGVGFDFSIFDMKDNRLPCGEFQRRDL